MIGLSSGASATAELVDGWAIAVHELGHKYGAHQALSNINFVARYGRLSCLLGPNGAGKSTLVHCMVGMLNPTEGVVKVSGGSARDRIGFVYDDLPLPLSLTGAEVLALLKATHARWDGGLIDQLTEVLGMGSAMGRLLGTYSHGMKRKLQLIAALGHRPAIWVLDEPFRGIDPVATAILRSLIKQFLNDGGAVIPATHDLLAAERVADDVVVIADGRIVRAGTVPELVLPGTSLQDVYLAATGLEVEVDKAVDEICALDLSADGRRARASEEERCPSRDPR